MAGAGTVVTSGDVKGFRWDLVAFRDGNRTCYRVDHRESVAGRDCADLEAREIAAASIIYVDAVPFAVGIAGQEVEQVSIKYSIAYSFGRDGEIQYEPGETRQTTVGWDRSDATLFIAAMPKGVRLEEVTAAQ